MPFPCGLPKIRSYVTLFQFSRERLKLYRFVAFQIYFTQKSVAVNVHDCLAWALGCAALYDKYAKPFKILTIFR